MRESHVDQTCRVRCGIFGALIGQGEDQVGRHARRVGDRGAQRGGAERDVVKATCLNDKLTQVNVALRTAVERHTTLTNAAARGDVELGAHEFTIIGVLRSRVDQLAAEANQCIGEETALFTETVVTASVDVSSRRIAPPSPAPPPPPREPQKEVTKIVQTSPGAATGGRGGELKQRAPAPAKPVAGAPAAQPPPVTQPQVTLPQQQPASVLAADTPHDETLMVYSAEIGLAVKHIGQAEDSIETIARAMGGFLSQRADRQVTVLVPRERFTDALAKIEALGDVRHHAISSLDVTDEYVDLEVRLTNARAIRERLLALRAQTPAVMDLIEIERELGRITGDIDRMEGKLRLLREKIAYSTITVSLEARSEPIVCATTLLPFPWLQDVGLSSLLGVHR